MNTQLIIPTKIHVGQVTRTDTYTGKLGYVIYTDTKGVKRKETSWQGWRDKTITPLDFDNIPTSGFVLNKGVGGARGSYSSSNVRQEKIRVFDPRGFEMEIPVSNVLFILQECTSTKGKGLEGEFVYSWDGKDMVLLPVDCEEYKKSTDFTGLQTKGILAKDLILGATYLSKKQNTWIYIGRHDHFELSGTYSRDRTIIKTKYYIFIDEDGNRVLEKSPSKVAMLIDETCVSNYAELVSDFYNSKNGTKPISVVFELNEKELEVIETGEYWEKLKLEGGTFLKENDNTYKLMSYQLKGDNLIAFEKSPLVKENENYSVIVNEGDKLSLKHKNNKNNYYYSYYFDHNKGAMKNFNDIKFLPLGELYILLESGEKFKYSEY